MFKVQFDCPVCGTNKIEQVAEGSFVSQLVAIVDNGENVQKDLEITEEFVQRFQCFECGFVLKDDNGNYISDPEELYEHLLENGWVSNEEYEDTITAERASYMKEQLNT